MTNLTYATTIQQKLAQTKARKAKRTAKGERLHIMGKTPKKGISVRPVPKSKRIKKLKAKLEKISIAYIKERDEFTCQKCGLKVEGHNCQASHVIPRSHSLRLKFDPLNLKVLCFYHHKRFWHESPVEAGEWFKRVYADRWYYLQNKLEEDKNKGSVHESEFQEMLDNLIVDYRTLTGRDFDFKK